MQLIIVTGLSGGGKSIAIRQLEDSGFYCIDNLAATWRTTQAMPDVIRLLADYDQLLEPKLFDPKTLKREFKIAGVDHGVFFLPRQLPKSQNLRPACRST